jgi:hypothetical protein
MPPLHSRRPARQKAAGMHQHVRSPIHLALEHGVTLFDTRAHVRRRRCERLVGQAPRGRRNQVVLASKVGILAWPVVGIPRGVSGKPPRVRPTETSNPGWPKPTTVADHLADECRASVDGGHTRPGDSSPNLSLLRQEPAPPASCACSRCAAGRFAASALTASACSPSRTRLDGWRSHATTAGATAEPGGSGRPVPRSQRSASPGSPAASRC